MIVDCVHYDGDERLQQGPDNVAEAAEWARGDSGFVWVAIDDPEPDELERLGELFDLHPLALEDAGTAHQRPKLEDYGPDQHFLVLRTARYHDEREAVDFGEIHLFIGERYVISVRHREACELSGARRRLESQPQLLATGTGSVVWAIVDVVVDEYFPVAEGLDVDVSEVEEQVFSQRTHPTERIYFLKREVLSFHRSVWPLLRPLERLSADAISHLDEEVRSFFRDVYDHAKRIDELVDSQRELLDGALQANAALQGIHQNETVQKISAWAAILAAPTLISGIYGMNFEHMPELTVSFGYPLALALMVAVSAVLYRFFRRIGWM